MHFNYYIHTYRFNNDFMFTSTLKIYRLSTKCLNNVLSMFLIKSDFRDKWGLKIIDNLEPESDPPKSLKKEDKEYHYQVFRHIQQTQQCKCNRHNSVYFTDTTVYISQTQQCIFIRQSSVYITDAIVYIIQQTQQCN